MRNPRVVKSVICLLIVIATLAAFSQVVKNEFINFDDGVYVLANTYVRMGLTRDSIVWAFTSREYAANWHPLTWISHMADVRMFGLNPAGHHATSLALHILTSILLFLLLDRMTRSVWRSAFVAALFAVHPLHVESVAWVAERKDVLSALFWVLTTWAYVRYAEKPGVGRYLVVVLLFALGLMSKPMLVTLPIVMLLLDYWPLDRFSVPKAKGKQPVGPRWPKLVMEKVPLLVMSGVSAVITKVAQSAGDAVVPLGDIAFPLRMANALVSYIAYLVKMVWPLKLAIYYPHPLDMLPEWQVVGSALFLIVITVLAVRFGRSRKYLLVGWLWYVVTLVPVIGLMQVGEQGMADRYTYIPLLGIFVILAWGIPELFARRRAMLAIPAVVVLVVLIVLTVRQVGYWKNSETLFRQALTVTDPDRNYLAHSNLGVALGMAGRREESLKHYRKALDIMPWSVNAMHNVGSTLGDMGQYDEAISVLKRALELQSDYTPAMANLGSYLSKKGEADEGVEWIRKALEIDPNYARGHFLLAQSLGMQGKNVEARDHYLVALALNPGDPVLMNTVAWMMSTSKDDRVRDGARAVEIAEEACRITQYRHAGFLDTLAAAYAEVGRYDEAVDAQKRVIELAESRNMTTAVQQATERLRLYEQGKPYRE